MYNLPFRQIHMDFHTSPQIPDVGADFDADRYADTLKDAHVNSVTCFARGHHGMCYYDTEIGPKHPSLQFDMFGQMVEACHERDIRVPAYITVAWDEWAARQHPEWAAINEDGSMWTCSPNRAGWHGVCMLNDDYQDYLLDITEEVLRKYEVDGIFMDIWMGPEPSCYCWSCLEKMRESGVDIEDDEAVEEWNVKERTALMKRVRSLAEDIRPGGGVFFNSCLEVGRKDWLEYYTHLEIESLPSGGWGYAHFPLFQRYFRNFGKQTMGMTARFHRTWGDFGGLKNQAALEFECFSMLAGGARCSVGDQLHPRGQLDQAVYDLIGPVYESVERKEPWCDGARHLAPIAIMRDDRMGDGVGGAVRALLECHEMFDVVDPDGDLASYEMLLVPDGLRVGEAIKGRLRRFVEKGGNLIICGESGLAPGEDRFAMSEIGVRHEKPAEYDPNFICGLSEDFSEGIREFHYMMYEGGQYVEARPGSEVHARIGEPYFNRNWEHFCSHGPTPFDSESDRPAIVRNGNVIYFAHPIFRLYADQGARVYRQLIHNAICLLRSQPLLIDDLPSTARVGLLRQEDPERMILHVLNYVAERRTDLDVIEEAQTVVEAELAVRTEYQPEEVYLAPEREPVAFEFADGFTRVNIPRIDGHTMIVFERGEEG